MAFFFLNLSYVSLLRVFVFVVAVIFISLFSINTANANVSWQWSASQGNERIVIDMGDTSKELSLERIAKLQIALSLSQVPRQFVGDNNTISQSKMLSNISLHGNDINLSFKTPNFGYMVIRPNPKQIVIYLFYDHLGARWVSQGKLLSENAAAKNAIAENVAKAEKAVKSEKIAKDEALREKELDAILAEQHSILKGVDNKLAVPANAKVADFSNNADNIGFSSAQVDASESNNIDVPLWVEVKAILSSKAYAAQEILPKAVNGKPVIINPQSIRSSINRQGPEGWKDQEGLFTILEKPLESKDNLQDSAEGSSDNLEPALQGDVSQAQPMPVVSATGQLPQPEGDDAIQRQQPEENKLPVNISEPKREAPPALQGGAVSQQEVKARVAAPPMQGKAGDQQEEKVSSEVGQAEQSVSTARQKAVQAPFIENIEVDVPVIYHNERGEVISKPIEPDTLLVEASALTEAGDPVGSLAVLVELKKLPISREMLEKVLYMISDATADIYSDKHLEGFDPIVASTSEAMNANLRSSRVPDALFRIGMANLSVGNLQEAEGYFGLLRRRYPYDINVPFSYVILGQKLLEAGKYENAAKNFRIVINDYLESTSLKPAAVGLANSLYAMGDADELDVITEFIGKRWPRHYIDDQKYLLMLAESYVNKNKLEDALETYWHYYNLIPGNPENHILLARIGDIYLRLNQEDLAFELFDDVIARYPNTEGAAYSTLRRAELGIHDSPIAIPEMFEVFSKIKDKTEPNKAYYTLMNEYAGEPLTILAELKFAMLQLWKKNYVEAIAAAADFIDKYPDHKDVNEARDVIYKAFLEEHKNAMAEQNYGRILSLWNGFPLIRQRYGKLDDEMRYALARGELEKGEDVKALELLSEFLKTPKNQKYGDYALTLFFNKYLQAGDWNAMLDLANLVADWKMDIKMRSQLDYAQALSAENLGLTEMSLSLWDNIAKKTENVELYEKAYATYFLAKDAERRKDIEDAYRYNVATLNMFKQLQQDRSDKSDPERIKESIGSLMDITEVANRIPEALNWVQEYKEYIPTDSPDLVGLRFREARLYRKLGDLEKSKSILEQIVDSDPESAFGMAAALELRTFDVSRNLRKFLPEGTQ